MRDPSKPDNQADEYMPDLPNAHKPDRMPKTDPEGIDPRDTSSMPCPIPPRSARATMSAKAKSVHP